MVIWTIIKMITIQTQLCIHLPNDNLLDVLPTVGRGGRVAGSGRTLSSYVAKNIAIKKMDDKNPREAILRHAKEAKENPFWISPAYKQ